MDLETENRIAAILMKEAAELRRQAEKEGVHAYVQQRKVRGRPNSRFLTATVLGVQQSNRSVEMSEMWRVRQKEINLDNKLKRNSGEESSSSHRQYTSTPRSTSSGHRHTSKNNDASSPSRKREVDCYSREDGLRDEEIEEFLHSRVKRGRGEIGSRMDETGPYLLPASDSTETLSDIRVREDWEDRIFGPEKATSLKLQKSSEDESDGDDCKKVKKAETVSLKKAESKKHKRKEDDKHRHKKKKEKKRRHQSKSR